METFKIGICEPEDFSKKAITDLSQIGIVSLFDGGDLKSFIRDKNAIFVRLKYLIDDQLISECANLKYICSPTTGLNHIRITNPKILVVSLRGEYDFLNSIRATPEHVFGLALALLRNYSHAFLNSNNATWNRDLYKGYELYKNKVGIIGLGRIGAIIARYFLAFDSEVFFYDVDQSKIIDGCVKCDSIVQLLTKSNIIILEANYSIENEKMIDGRLLSLMHNKYFINAARGELVDESALIKLIENNWFKGVAIDVVSNETNNICSISKLIALADTHNVIITPHIGGATYSSMERTEEYIANKLVQIICKEEK